MAFSSANHPDGSPKDTTVNVKSGHSCEWALGWESGNDEGEGEGEGAGRSRRCWGGGRREGPRTMYWGLSGKLHLLYAFFSWGEVGRGRLTAYMQVQSGGWKGRASGN